MYEARQNKEKVSRRIDGEAKNNQNSKNIFQFMAVNPLPANVISNVVKSCKVWANRNLLLQGNVYYSKIIMPQSSVKTNLLAKIASVAAEAGKNVNIANAMQNGNWTNQQNSMNTAVATIDPCRIRLRAGKKNARIEAEWHFGGYNQGYIMSMRDDQAVQHRNARLTRRNHNYAINHTGTNSMSGIDLYSERHNIPNPIINNILSRANNVRLPHITNNDISTSWDAHTILLGEGARWNFVRGNLTKIREDTYIGTIGNNNAQRPGILNPGIQFRDLWCCWGSVFRKQYGISNAVVRHELLNRNPWPTSNNNRVIYLTPNANLQTNRIMI